MMNVPGSIPWLIRHELRLSWFNAATSKPGKPGKTPPRRPGTAGLASIGVLWLALHALAYFTVGKLDGLDTADPRIAIVVGALLYGLMSVMLSSALKSSVVALFVRGDLDLLLSSPLPSRSIFTVRLGAVALGTAAPYLIFLGPFAHMGVLSGHAGWLAIYPVMLGAAAIVACAAMLLTLGLVRTIGVRRTRVVAQIIGALAGAMIFILLQVFSHFASRMEAQDAGAFARLFASGGLLGMDSALWLPGRALLGEPLPIVGVVALAATAFTFTAARTHRFFVHGLQEAASSTRTARRPAGGVRYRFGRSMVATVLLKEWRLIMRDPHLISQVALQLLYLVPLFFVVFKGGELRMAALGAGLTLLCSSLTASLAWIVVSAEDAPDLLRLSPAPRSTIRLAKLGAAILPSLALILIPLTWLLLRDPLPGLVVVVCVTGAVCSAALIVHWCGRPGSRSDFKARGKSDTLTTILQMCNSLAWGGLVWALATLIESVSNKLIAFSSFTALSVAALLGLSWFLRRPQA
jgi:ABC-2 type transport system permease protein